MRSVVARAVLSLSLASCLGLGCGGGEVPPPAASPARANRCAGAALSACGAELARAVDEGTGLAPALDAYLAGLSGPWVGLAQTMRAPAAPQERTLVLVLAAGTDAPALPGARLVDATKAGAPPGVPVDALALALAARVGLEHVVLVDAEGLRQGFPNDPLAPMTLGLRPVVASAGAAALEGEIELAAGVRAALGAASRFDYVAAARAADALRAALSRAPEGAGRARARLALRLLDGAGLALERDAVSEGTPPTKDVDPAPAPRDTPYAHVVLLRAAQEPSAAWAARRAPILAALPADRRAPTEAYFATLAECPPAFELPPMERPADLLFGWTLVSSSLPEGASPDERKRAVELWLARYGAYAELVERTGTTWLAAPLLLHRRGEALGLSPEGTPTHGRVTRLALAHVEALSRLAAAEPKRFQAIALVPLSQSPGALRDEKLAPALVALTQRATEAKLHAAVSAAEVASAALTAALGSMSQPPGVREAQLAGLDRALDEALRGPLRTEHGWGTAGLYVAHAAARLMASQPADLRFTAAEVERALARQTELPGLAALATVAARYGGLAAEGRLDPEQRDEARFAPDRKAAKDALRRALAGLGAPGEAPAAVVDDLATLVDGLIAVLAFTATSRDPGAAVACSSPSYVSLPPAVARSLAKLGDVRRKVLASPRLKAGKDAWSRQARALALVLSDTIDVLQKKGPAVTFVVPPEVATTYLADALSGLDEKAAADGVGAAYGLIRGYLGSERGEAFLLQNGASWRRLFVAIAAFLRTGGSEGSARLFETMGGRASTLAEGGGAALGGELLGYAESLYAAGQKDHGDLLLIAGLAVGAARGEPLPPRALALADGQKSRAAWALRFESEITEASGRRAPEPERFAEALRSTSSLTCEPRGAEPVLQVFDAMKSFAAGRRAEARRSLDAWLDDAEKRGLVLPKVAFRFEETGTRVFQVSVDLSFGAGLVQASTFQLGLGMRAEGEAGSRLEVARGASTDEEAARYYVHVAALASAYHFLDGDAARGARDAQRVLGAALGGARLGTKTVPATGEHGLALDSRSTIAVVAELAAEARLPFLAGDLWTIVRDTFYPTLSDADVADMLARPPLGLAGLTESSALLERTRHALRVLAEPLACTEAKVDRSAYDYPACDLYPHALALRVADATRQMPRLATTSGSAARACASESAVDRFLVQKEQGTYDPDALTAAVAQAEAAGHTYDAAALLTRLRAEPHCSAAVIGAARRLGHTAELGPSLRADLLSVAVNCGAAELDEAAVADLSAVDDALALLPDPSRGFATLLSTLELADRTGRWDVLARLVDKPGFLARWTATTPFAATAALLLDQATGTLVGKPRDGAATAADVGLFCETFPPADRADTCTWLRTLRSQGAAPEADRKASARSALRALLKQVRR